MGFTKSHITQPSHQQSFIKSQPTSILKTKIRPIVDHSKGTQIFSHEFSNRLLKIYLKSLWRDDSLEFKRKLYQNRRSIEKISEFFAEFRLNGFQPNSCHLKHLFQLTKHLRKLQSPKLLQTFSSYSEDLKKIELSLKARQNITSLSFNFAYNKTITDTDLKRLFARLQTLTKVSTLVVDLTSCSKITAQSLKSLSDAIRRSRNLSSLHLSLGSNNSIIQDSTIERLVSEIAKHKNLSELYLDFKENSQLTSKSLQKIVTCLQGLRFLTKVTLIMDTCKRVSLDELHHGLENLKLLSHLTLNFSNNYNITNSAIESLANVLPNLKSLTCFEFIFRRCLNVGDQGLCALFNQLKNCKKLKTILLNFRANLKIGNASLIALASLFKEIGEELSELSLDFSLCPKITETGFQSLFEALGHLKNIKSLKLYLLYNKGFTGKALMALGSNTTIWTSLTALTLDFRFCSKVTGEHVKAICIALQDVRLQPIIFINFTVKRLAEEIQNEILCLLKKVEAEKIHCNFVEISEMGEKPRRSSLMCFDDLPFDDDLI